MQLHFSKRFLCLGLPSSFCSTLVPASLLQEFRLICGEDTSEDDGDVTEEMRFIETKIFPQLLPRISDLKASEFDKMVEEMLTFVLLEWRFSKCFVSLSYIGQIFGHISCVAPKSVINEFLVSFSKEDVPPQIKYIILPEIAKHLKHPVKNVITDTTMYHMIYFMRMTKHPLNKNSTAAVDEKFIRPFWINLQYKWTDRMASSLVSVFVQLVDVLPTLSQDTLTEAKKAVTAQFSTEEDKIPIYSLLAASVVLLGFRQIQYKFTEGNWTELTKICSAILRQCCRRSGQNFDGSVSSAHGLRSFIVRMISTFLSEVKLESEAMMDDIVQFFPRLNATQPQLCTDALTLSSTEITSNSKSLVEELEDLIVKIQGSQLLDTADKARILKSVAELEAVCR